MILKKWAMVIVLENIRWVSLSLLGFGEVIKEGRFPFHSTFFYQAILHYHNTTIPHLNISKSNFHTDTISYLPSKSRVLTSLLTRQTMSSSKTKKDIWGNTIVKGDTPTTSDSSSSDMKDSGKKDICYQEPKKEDTMDVEASKKDPNSAVYVQPKQE